MTRRGPAPLLAALGGLLLAPGCVSLVEDAFNPSSDFCRELPVTRAAFITGGLLVGAPTIVLCAPFTTFLGDPVAMLWPGLLGVPVGLAAAAPFAPVELLLRAVPGWLRGRSDLPPPSPEAPPCATCGRSAPCLCAWPPPTSAAEDAPWRAPRPCACGAPLAGEDGACDACGGVLPE